MAILFLKWRVFGSIYSNITQYVLTLFLNSVLYIYNILNYFGDIMKIVNCIRFVKWICAVSSIFAIIFTSTSCSAHITTALPSVDLKENGHITQLHDYDSPYTICYENSDNTYSMYIFSAPIQYKTDSGYAVIDNAVVKSKKEGYVFENKANDIKTYFRKSPQEFCRVERKDEYIEFMPEDSKGFSDAKHIAYTNMYGTKVDAVRYERKDLDLVFYPVRSGIKMEVVLKEKPKSGTFTYFLQTHGSSAINKQNGYVLFKNGNSNAALVYQPLVAYQKKEGEEQLDISSTMEVGGGFGVYTVKINLNPDILDDVDLQYPLKFDPSFELYLNKMPDSGVYSEAPSMNAYLSALDIVGTHDLLGYCRQFKRFRFNYVLNCYPDTILSSTYVLQDLTGFSSTTTLSLRELSQQWSSTKLSWSQMSCDGNDIMKMDFQSGKLSIDLTSFTKDCFADRSGTKESQGLLLYGKEEKGTVDYRVFGSSDNAEYPPYLVLELSELPRNFYVRDNINPPMN